MFSFRIIKLRFSFLIFNIFFISAFWGMIYAQLENDGVGNIQVLYENKFPVNIYYTASDLPQKKQYLESIVVNLIFDQLSIQKTAFVPKRSIKKIIYPFQKKSPESVLPEDPFDKLLGDRADTSGFFPVFRKKVMQKPVILGPDAFHLLTNVSYKEESKVNLKVDLFFAKESLFTREISFQENDLVDKVKIISEDIRKALNGGKGAHLEVTSNPKRASVYINDMFIGKTPLSVKWLPWGEHTLRLKHEGFVDVISRVRLQADETTTYNGNFENNIATGALDIDSVPTARVYLGVEYKGKTPLKLQHLGVGPQRVRLSAQGHVDKYLSVRVQKGKSEKIRYVLTQGSNQEYYNPRPNIFLGLTYSRLSKISLIGGFAFLGGSVFSMVRQDQVREKMYADLSTLNPSDYTIQDKKTIADSENLQERYRNASIIMGVSSLVFFSAAIYFFIQDAFTQDLEYAKVISPDNNKYGSVKIFSGYRKDGTFQGSIRYTF